MMRTRGTFTPSSDGRVLVTLKTVWRDGTSHLLFEPIQFMEKLAAIIPRPAVNVVEDIGHCLEAGVNFVVDSIETPPECKEFLLGQGGKVVY